MGVIPCWFESHPRNQLFSILTRYTAILREDLKRLPVSFTVATIRARPDACTFPPGTLKILQQRLLRPVFARPAFVALVATFILVQTSNHISDAQRRRPPRTSRVAAMPIEAAKYSTFTHHTHGPEGPDARAKLLKCSDCHTVPPAGEATAAAEAKLADPLKHQPYHDKCFGCHEREIYRTARPAICSVCHSHVSPRATARDVYEWKFITTNFNHVGGGINRRHVAECGSCHKVKAETTRVKYPGAPIAACFQCHKSSKPVIAAEIDKYEDILQDKALKPNEPRECVGCHLPEVGKMPPPCSHFKLFGYDYFDAENYPQIAKELARRREKKSCSED